MSLWYLSEPYLVSIFQLLLFHLNFFRMSNKILFGILLQSLILAYSSAAPTQPCSNGDIILERITDQGGKVGSFAN